MLWWRMCRCSVATWCFARPRPAVPARPAPPAPRPEGTLHSASTETGWVAAVRSSADHEEENFRAAKLVWALPPLFVSVLHERDLRSFQRPAPSHLSTACASRCRSALPTERVRRGLDGVLTLIWLSAISVAREKMPPAHNCDRSPRGWFSSQIPDFLRRRRMRNTCAARSGIPSYLGVFRYVSSPTDGLVCTGKEPSSNVSVPNSMFTST